MVNRYESDEDASEGFRPQPGAGPTAPGARRTTSAGPAPSRFPTPVLPRVTPPAAEPARGAVPVPQPVAQPAGPEPAPPAAGFPAEPAPPTGPPAYAGQAPGGSPPARPPGSGGRLWQVVVGGTAVLVLLAVGGLGTAAILLDRESGALPQGVPTAPPAVSPSPSPAADDLDSRDTDPLPLTANEVFPGRRLVVAAGQPGYQVLRTHSSGSCAVAATDDLADLLARLGCNQVVRGTLRAPDGTYLATAGLLNLTDRATAERVRDRTREILQERRGRFLGMTAGTGTEVLTTAAARVSWQARGHYVAYCMVVRADGEPVRPDDRAAKQMLLDLVQTHLEQAVLDRRADGDLVQPSPGPDD